MQCWHLLVVELVLHSAEIVPWVYSVYVKKVGSLAVFRLERDSQTDQPWPETLVFFYRVKESNFDSELMSCLRLGRLDLSVSLRKCRLGPSAVPCPEPVWPMRTPRTCWSALRSASVRSASVRSTAGHGSTAVLRVKGDESCCLWLRELYIWLLHSCIGGIWRVPRRCKSVDPLMCSFKLDLLFQTLHCAIVQLLKSQITEALSYICGDPQDLSWCGKNNLTTTTKKHTEERKLPCFWLCPLPYIHSWSLDLGVIMAWAKDSRKYCFYDVLWGNTPHSVLLYKYIPSQEESPHQAGTKCMCPLTLLIPVCWTRRNDCHHLILQICGGSELFCFVCYNSQSKSLPILLNTKHMQMAQT